MEKKERYDKKEFELLKKLNNLNGNFYKMDNGIKNYLQKHNAKMNNLLNDNIFLISRLGYKIKKIYIKEYFFYS